MFRFHFAKSDLKISILGPPQIIQTAYSIERVLRPLRLSSCSMVVPFADVKFIKDRSVFFEHSASPTLFLINKKSAGIDTL